MSADTLVLFCVQCCVYRKRLSSPRCRSELIDSAWVVIVPGRKKHIKKINPRPYIHLTLHLQKRKGGLKSRNIERMCYMDDHYSPILPPMDDPYSPILPPMDDPYSPILPPMDDPYSPVLPPMDDPYFPILPPMDDPYSPVLPAMDDPYSPILPPKTHFSLN